MYGPSPNSKWLERYQIYKTEASDWCHMALGTYSTKHTSLGTSWVYRTCTLQHGPISQPKKFNCADTMK